MFRRELVQALPLARQRFEFCPEVTAKVRQRGYRIHEVPIRYQARGLAAGRRSAGKYGAVALWAVLKYRLWTKSRPAVSNAT